ncbi:MAG TPA: protein kinase, partial [Pyrinomonadaceae bacterium]|nr:protein kinase [Pyrinomonadaceae bacterium]
ASFSLESPTMIPSSLDESRKAAQSGSAAKPEAEFIEPPTMIRAPLSVTEEDDEESSTRLLPAPPPPVEEEGTRILDKHTTGKQLGANTAVDERLTRIGSILGTPLYMSPEQCRGDTSDARSDIYSLGVIGYQMLAGQTPFNGNMETVIQQHLTAQPPPLDVKKVPKKVARVIMAALAKNPAERPRSAAAFGGALRAHSAGTGELLRQSLTLFGEHMPLFMRLALILYSPLILLTILALIEAHLYGRGTISQSTHNILSPIQDLFRMVVTFFVAGCVLALTTWVVTQLLVAPLRPLKLKPAFEALRKRLKTLTLTSMALSFMTMLGIVLCFIPGFIVLINFFLVTPVVMMEEQKGRAAFKRARELASRSWRTVITVVFLQMLAPILVATIVAFLAVVTVKAFSPAQLKVRTFVPFFNTIFQLAQMPLIFLIGSYSAVVTSLLYWKTRLAGGETLKEAFQEFEEEEMPDRNWQKRMRERLHLTTRMNRSDGGRSRLDR